MAFHQPTRQHAQRPIRLDTTPYSPEPTALPAPQPTTDSQTWVLFSPTTDAETTTSYLSSLPSTSQKTPGRSRLSDLGSGTLARSDVNSHPIPAGLSDILTPSEDDAELDSLDSHLPDFLHAQPHASTTVLPRHDGLGSFTAAEIQEQLYAFERYNPRRIRRRRSSFDLAQFEAESERAAEAERNKRVEAWRMDQSRTFLEEVQKQTRRRRISGTSAQRPRVTRTTSLDSAVEMTPESTAAGSEWHDQDEGVASGEVDGVWSWLTRRFMKDYMGIDDTMLSVLLGEALPEMDDDLSSTPRASAAMGAGAVAAEEMALQETSSWQMRLLERVARELGIFVHHMSHPHPGAFSTYSRVHGMALPYAGLPAIPEMAADIPEAVEAVRGSAPAAMPQFKPTVAAIDIPGRASTTEVQHETALPTDSSRRAEGTFTQQEWEQDLDIRLVFRYLRSRFISSRPASTSSSHTHHHAQPSRPLTPSETAARAARVRAHHPLVNRSRQPAGVSEGGRRTAATAMSVGLGVGHFVVRHASSCASQSTKRRSSVSVSSKASERYGWMGSMGSAGWGEV